jgi:hypothetical protein
VCRCIAFSVKIPLASGKFLLNGCADAHSFSLLEGSNTTEANVVKALPYLMVKAKGDLDPFVCLTENEKEQIYYERFEKRAGRGESGLTREAWTSNERLRSRSLVSSPRSDGI